MVEVSVTTAILSFFLSVFLSFGGCFPVEQMRFDHGINHPPAFTVSHTHQAQNHVLLSAENVLTSGLWPRSSLPFAALNFTKFFIRLG